MTWFDLAGIAAIGLTVVDVVLARNFRALHAAVMVVGLALIIGERAL